MRTTRPVTAALLAVGLGLLGCEAEEDPVSPDPDGLEEPADDPEGAGVDDGLDDAEEGTGEPAPEGEGDAGRLEPGDDEDE